VTRTTAAAHVIWKLYRIVNHHNNHHYY